MIYLWQGVLEDSNPPCVLRPATVISTGRNLSEQDIVDEIKGFLARDDVYSEDFASTIVIHMPARVALDSHINRSSCHLYSLKNSHLDYSLARGGENLLPSGPYFLYNDGIYEAWRLYPDDLDAFEVAVVLQDRYRPARWDQYTSNNQAAASWPWPARFSPLKLLDQEGLWKSIAVPSRLYAQKSRKHPLAGVRISVKDNSKLAGIKTTMTNRAFTQLYPAEFETAEYVETLLRLGAIIVGKSKMCSFAAGENPGDWIDSHCPVNPRGDQYQSPGSSTAGGGASLAGYSWLDYSIGTDSESTDPWYGRTLR